MIYADGESGIIPNWVKNNAGLWSENQITETEYVASLQYLINEGIIKVNNPIQNVLATGVLIPDEQRAHSFAVHFKNTE